jgi:hypothetical protein
MSERKTKRQSGAFYRKRNNERDTEREKFRGSMLKYLKMATSTTTVNSQCNSNSKDKFETDISNESHQPEFRLDEEIVPCSSDIETSGNEDNCLEVTTDFNIEDPYCWHLLLIIEQ